VNAGPVRWGIVGAGRIAHSFARDMAAASGAELVAVAAREPSRARAFGDRYQIDTSYGDYADLYAAADVDAVYVATPHSCHLDNCRDALASGKAVLCEKPLVLDPAECQALIEAAGVSGNYLVEGMWTWFLPAVRRALDWYQAGRIGQLLHLKSDFGYPLAYGERVREYDARLGGGAVLEMGIYPVAIARLFTGRGPEDIRVSGHRAPNGVEDDMVAICDYGDCTATLSTSFRCKLPNWTYLVGTDGTIAIPDFWRAQRCLLYRLDQLVDEFDDGRATEGFDYEIEAVSREIAAGASESATVPLATSLALQQDMAALRRAIPGDA
jgi:predicted dehydrogenase